MALKETHFEGMADVGHVSHDAQVRIDRRVAEILARLEAASAHAHAGEDEQREATREPVPAGRD